MIQNIHEGPITPNLLEELMSFLNIKRLLLVSGKSISALPFGPFLQNISVKVAAFNGFAPNPTYESVVEGVDVFHQHRCDGILAVGGGSALDVAKCIKLFSGMKKGGYYLEEPFKDSGIPLIAIPTTAGTGSESTHFSVIYQNQIKLSVAHFSILPNLVLLDSQSLHSLPLYQKKVTMLDAICQAIESWWSLSSTEESILLSQKALKLLFTYRYDYLLGDVTAAKEIMTGANLAGQGINITKTTAPHAMSYQLTTLFNLPHGHAVAIMLPGIWRYMYNHVEETHDPRGSAYLATVFESIAATMGFSDVPSAIHHFEIYLDELEISRPFIKEEQLNLLVDSVDPQRLQNNPVLFSKEVLYQLYKGEKAK